MISLNLKRAMYSVVTGSLIAGSVVSVSSELCSAQDLLPRDNTIFTYHRTPRYRPSESHPLRTFAYMLHPIGWVLNEAIYRPMSSFVSSTEFNRSFFGYREPFDYREPECFSSSDSVPDCKQLPPLMNIGKYKNVGDVNSNSDSERVAVSANQVFFPDINFDFNKATLNEVGKGRVRQVSQLLSSAPALSVVVEGHADYKGTDEYNIKLGEKRAQAVISELVELGIDTSRLSPISYGEGKPVYTEEEDWARAVNRRVQFSVKGQAPQETAAVEKE